MEDTCFLARGRANETCMVLPPSRLSFSINMAFSADALHKTETQVRHHAKNQDQAATFFWVGGGGDRGDYRPIKNKYAYWPVGRYKSLLDKKVKPKNTNTYLLEYVTKPQCFPSSTLA
jgi:hypothetical protein